MCACGRMAVKTLSVRYRYLRAEPLPDAMDPHYVLGGGYRVSLCGNPFCERRAFVTGHLAGASPGVQAGDSPCPEMHGGETPPW